MPTPKTKPTERKAGPKRKIGWTTNPLARHSPDNPARELAQATALVNTETGGQQYPQTGGQHGIPLDGPPSRLVDSLVDSKKTRKLSAPRSGGQHDIQTGGQHSPQSRHGKHLLKHETIRLPESLLAQVGEFCKREGLTKTEFWARLAVHHFEQPTALQSAIFSTVDSKVGTHDDETCHEDDKNIIMQLYQTYTGNIPKTRDRRLALKFKAVDLKLIETAIITTIEKKLRGNTAREHIKSFAYFVPEIETFLALVEERQLPGGLGDYHRFVLGKWKSDISKRAREKWGNSLIGGGKPEN